MKHSRSRIHSNTPKEGLLTTISDSTPKGVTDKNREGLVSLLQTEKLTIRNNAQSLHHVDIPEAQNNMVNGAKSVSQTQLVNERDQPTDR